MGRAAIRLAVVVAVMAVVQPGCKDDGDSGGTASPSMPAAGAAKAGPLGPLPVPRTEVAGTVWRGALVVAGGLTADGGASALVHTYDAGAGEWTALPSLPVPLHHAGLAVLGGRLYTAGGYTNGPGQTWAPQAAVRSLGPGDEQWRDEPPLAGGPRGALGLAATSTSLVAIGGELGGQAVSRVELFDAGAPAWRPGVAMNRAREHLGVAVKGDRVFAVAGRTAEAGNMKVVESINPALDSEWRTELDLNDPRGGIGAAVVEGRLCVAGGEEEGGTIASVECLDGSRWQRAGRLPHPRHGLAVMSLDGRLHVVGGGETPGLSVSDIHEALDV